LGTESDAGASENPEAITKVPNKLDQHPNHCASFNMSPTPPFSRTDRQIVASVEEIKIGVVAATEFSTKAEMVGETKDKAVGCAAPPMAARRPSSITAEVSDSDSRVRN